MKLIEKNRFAKAVFWTLGLLLASSALIAASKPTTEIISLAAYLGETETPTATNESPIFDRVLWVEPVKMDCKPRGSLSPDEVFVGKFEDELQRGAAAYFKMKRRFKDASTDAGDWGMQIRIVNYEGGVGKPPRLAIGVEIKMIQKKAGVSLLEGTAESFLENCPKNLSEPVITPFKSGQVILKIGTVRVSELCDTIFKRIDSQLIDNKDLIFKKLKEALNE